MLPDQILMRWDGIPIAKINKGFQVKIMKKVKKNPTIKWFGYTGVEWIKAFDAKQTAEQKCYLDNINAALSMKKTREKKEQENIRVVTKLLTAICDAAHL